MKKHGEFLAALDEAIAKNPELASLKKCLTMLSEGHVEARLDIARAVECLNALTPQIDRIVGSNRRMQVNVEAINNNLDKILKITEPKTEKLTGADPPVLH